VAEGYHSLHGKLVDRFGSQVGEALYSFVASMLAAVGVSTFLR
jgi:hypothetical protein